MVDTIFRLLGALYQVSFYRKSNYQSFPKFPSLQRNDSAKRDLPMYIDDMDEPNDTL